MRTTTYKCDGCGVTLSSEDESRERFFKLRTPFHEAEIDICRSCWEKMCAALGKIWDTGDHRMVVRKVDIPDEVRDAAVRHANETGHYPRWFVLLEAGKYSGPVPGVCTRCSP